ncbi:MAG: M28 family peptidase [Bacteroidota bacterium]
MKYILSISLVLMGTILGQAQDKNLPEFKLKKQTVEAHMRFLASDELQGRRTGEAGNQIAARYIASHLKAYGVETVAGAANYLQPVALEEKMPIQTATLTWEDQTFTQGDNLMMMSGEGDLETKAVFLGYGWVDEENDVNDYKGIDVKGKIVVTNIGSPDDNSPNAIFGAMRKKQQWARENGAIGMIELFQLPKSFWGRVTSYFGRPSMRIQDIASDQSSDFAYGWLFDAKKEFGVGIKKGKKNKVMLSSSGSNRRIVDADNVIGMIEGSDPQLKDEYVVLSAHYDHVGVGAQGGGAYSEQDSIFNGARDNAFGTVALLSAAQSLAMERPKRSIIVLAVTGEELGLLGSKYYADNPLIPLEKTIFNFNTDGAGYNDKTSVSVIGLGRTGIDEELKTASTQFGLTLGGDPAPEQGLFDRSDNVSFAAKGVPAVNFAPGMTAFDAAIMKYYHQVADNPDSIDYDYLLKYCQSFAYAARLIANKTERPMWKEGDKYEAAGKKLYNP